MVSLNGIAHAQAVERFKEKLGKNDRHCDRSNHAGPSAELLRDNSDDRYENERQKGLDSIRVESHHAAERSRDTDDTAATVFQFEPHQREL